MLCSHKLFYILFQPYPFPGHRECNLEYKHKPPRPISHFSLSPSRPLTQFGPSRFLPPSNILFSFSFTSLRAGPRHLLAYPLNTNYTFSCKQDFLFSFRLLTTFFFFFCFPAERHPVGCYLKQPKYNLAYIKSTIEKRKSEIDENEKLFSNFSPLCYWWCFGHNA